jgi:hypothetical protein
VIIAVLVLIGLAGLSLFFFIRWRRPKEVAPAMEPQREAESAPRP